MLNKAILMGRLTRDPELRYTQNNTPVVSFSIAVDRNYGGKSEERQTDFINIVAWRRTAEFVQNWFTKGQMIVVVGSIQTRRWQDRDGNNRVTVEVVADEVQFAGGKKDNGSSANAAPNYRTPQSGGRSAQGSYGVPDGSVPLPSGGDDFAELADEDEIPF